jgi:hypothetical protein
MQDRPKPQELIKAVTGLLKDTVLPQLSGRTAFEVRVAINALQLVDRELEHAANADRTELQRLEQLLGRSGTLLDLNRDLCERIASGAIEPSDQRLKEHLWASTMAKLAVDQPTYAAYQEELQREGGSNNGIQPIS